MAELPRIPVDGQTGVPMPLLHVEKPPRVSGPLWYDYDHSWPRDHDAAWPQTDADRALRYSLGQRVPRWLHELKNDKCGLPERPVTDFDQFQACVFGCARLIGPYAIDLTSDDWTVPVLMTLEQYRYETDPRRMYMQYGRNPLRFKGIRDHVGRYFAAFTLEHGTEHLSSEGIIKKFLGEKNPERRWALGNLLIKESVEATVAPVLPAFRQIQEVSPVPRRIDLRAVVHQFFVQRRFTDYHDTLASRLALQWA